jgi:hypothetical protein
MNNVIAATIDQVIAIATIQVILPAGARDTIVARSKSNNVGVLAAGHIVMGQHRAHLVQVGVPIKWNVARPTVGYIITCVIALITGLDRSDVRVVLNKPNNRTASRIQKKVPGY